MAHRKVVVGASVAVAAGLAAPVFLTLKKTLSRPTPSELPSLVDGIWRGVDQENDEHRLQFNTFGMAKYEGPFGKTKGPLKLTVDTSNSKLSTPILTGGGAMEDTAAGAGAVAAVQVVPALIEIEALLPNGWLGIEGLQLRAELEYEGADRDNLGAGFPTKLSSIRLLTQEAQAVLRKAPKGKGTGPASGAAAQVK